MIRGASTDFAFSMVEVTLALGVAAVALLAIVGLLPVGLQNNRLSSEQTAAPKIISAVAADLRATPKNATASPVFALQVPSNSSTSTVTAFFTSEGKHSDTFNSDSRYRLTVSFAPNSSGSTGATFASLILSWPAAVDLPLAAGSVEAFVALRRD
jgi:uncharacterized protein (TIGR02598 family)